MDATWQDIRYGVRMLLRNPVFSTMSVLTLGLGIGANTAVFSVINALLLQPLSFSDSERLLEMQAVNTKTGFDGINVSYPNFRDTIEMSRSLASGFAFRDVGVNMAGGDTPQRLEGLRVSTGTFEMLAFGPFSVGLFSTKSVFRAGRR